MLILGEVKVSKDNFLIMQPVIVIARIFGLCPIYYKNCGHFYMLHWSYLYALYSFLLPGTFATVTFLSMFEDEDNKVDRETDTKRQFLTYLDILTITLIVVFCIVTTPFRMRSLWKICRCITEVEKTLHLKSPRKYRRKSWIFIILVLIIYLIFYLYDVLTWHTQWEKIDSTLVFLKDYLPFYSLKFIMLNQILFFCHLVYFIKIRLICLNTYLYTIVTENITVISTIKNGELNVYPNAIEKNNPISTASRIGELAKSHRKLHEITEIINRTAAFGIVIIMFCLLLHLVVTPYFLLSELELDGRLFFIFLQIMWLIAHAGKFLILVETCQQCKAQGDETMYIVQKLLTDDIVDTVRDALIRFSLQLSKCRIQFNICGLFILDRSIIATFAATITTYLVVLQQINN